MAEKNSIQIVDLPKIEDDRGNLSFIEESTSIPFNIKRVYWIYDVPGTWRKIVNFSSGAICLGLASERYQQNDYLRYYNEFIAWKGLSKQNVYRQF